MGETKSLASATTAVDYAARLIRAVDARNTSWLVTAHVPGLGHIKASLVFDVSYRMGLPVRK
ncbi:hypothetical protein M2322_003991 [Rhodoblastus acidophilus]|uniref:hypothetical protein n=1 Tax=Rhodoblastus acidophilus TaxID=1074 RepID=UPI0022240B96|nr:hypothetical protein [Rhodoblastus acidophilus]MCW2318422.1 hypothetical protein [Rhodoblastus acidophilus]